jgi:hypothetical protein
MKDKYVVVTAVSTHRMRYVLPLDELQKLNPEVPVNPEWAMDCVTCQEVEEFSQKHIGELITDCNVLNEDEILELFDKDNDYLASWDRDYKIQHIRNWRETWSKT